MDARVAWISIAPVKALGLVHPREVELGPTGVRENRRFHVIDETGLMVNGKRFGPLVRIVPEYDADAGMLTLRFPDGAEVSGPVELGDEITTDFWGRPVAGRLVVGPWSEALSAYAGRALRLVQPERAGDGTDRGSRSGAVSLVSVASLEALARAAGHEATVDGRRFRMLFGVDGVGPHEEDTWLERRIQVGDAVIVPRGNVGRCAVTTQDPDTGVPDFDTLRVLKAYRDDVPTTERLPFGVYGQVAEPGRVRLGDPVVPTESL